VIARVLADLGTEHALVVHGADGLDEITTTGPTRVAEVREGEVHVFSVEPERFGLRRAALAELAGGSPEENAERMERVLAGEPGPLSDIAALNAGAALYVGGLVRDLEQGVERAREVLAGGGGAAKLEQLRSFLGRALGRALG
jgi:anthranilate phosphoribosyltransferase